MKIPASIMLTVLFSGALAGAQNASTTTKPVEPLQLKPTSRTPINLHMTDDAKNVYAAIAKLEGFNVIFDPDYLARHVQVDLSNASLNDALRIVGHLTGTFYTPVTPDTILVATNSRQKHVDYDDLETHTIYLKNATQQADANEVVTGDS